jgi:hypothetical protein
VRFRTANKDTGPAAGRNCLLALAISRQFG